MYMHLIIIDNNFVGGVSSISEHGTAQSHQHYFICYLTLELWSRLAQRF